MDLETLETVVSSAGDELMACSQHGQTERLFGTIVRILREVLRSESCSLFMRLPQEPGFITLCAQSSQKDGVSFDRSLKLPIHKKIRGGLTGYLFSQGRISRLDRADILNSEYASNQTTQDHLILGKCNSLIALPIRDRFGQQIGMFKAENKAVEFGGVFTIDDEAIAHILATKFTLAYNGAMFVETMLGFLNDINSSFRVRDIVRAVLNRCTALFSANRVSIALWSYSKTDLIMAGESIDGKLLFPTPEEVTPTLSAMRDLWRLKDTAIVAEIPLNSPAGASGENTNLFCRLQVGDGAIGMLGLEIGRTLVDDGTCDLLAQVTRQAAAAIEAVGSKSSISGIRFASGARIKGADRSNIRNTPKSLFSLSDALLAAILLDRVVEGAIIMLADYQSRVLLTTGTYSYHRESLDKDFVFLIDETSAVTNILKGTIGFKEGYYSEDPKQDLNFNALGLLHFKISSPWLGLPLINGTARLGVIATWGGKVQELQRIEREDFTRVVQTVSAILGKADQACEHILSAEVRARLETTAADDAVAPLSETLIRLVHLGCIAFGFERVRLFQVVSDGLALKCISSLSIVGVYSLRGNITTRVGNSYADHIDETFRSQPTARLYDPTDPTLFGTDPNINPFDKPHDLPWAVVPLVVGGGLFGQIAVDNRFSRKLIDNKSLEALTVLGACISNILDSGIRTTNEEELRRSNELYYSLVEKLPAALWRKNSEGTFTYVNGEFARIFPTNSGCLIGLSDNDIFTSRELIEGFRQGDQEAITNGFFTNPTENFQYPDGRNSIIHVVKVAVKDSRGNAIGTQGVFWDVTDRHRSAAALKRMLDESALMLSGSMSQEEILFRLATSLSELGVRTISVLRKHKAKEKWERCYPSIESGIQDDINIVSTIDLQPLETTRSLYIFEPSQNAINDIVLIGALSPENTSTTLVVLMTAPRSAILTDEPHNSPENDILNLPCNLYPRLLLTQALKAILGFTSTVLALGERTYLLTATASDLAASKRMTFNSNLLMLISHEVRNLLGVLEYRLLDVLADKSLTSRDRAPFERLSARAASSRSTLLGYMDLINDKKSENKDGSKCTRLEPVVRFVANLLKGKLKQSQTGHGEVIRIEINDDIDVFAGPVDLTMMMHNLISNAIKAVESVADPVIIITSEVLQDGKRAHIRVIDNGCGISADEVPHLFELGYSGFAEKEKRLGKTSSVAQPESTGIGLHSIKNMIESLGGTIRLNTDTETKKTTATLTLRIRHHS